MHATTEGIVSTSPFRSLWVHSYQTDLCQLGESEVHEGAVVGGKYQLLTSYERGERREKRGERREERGERREGRGEREGERGEGRGERGEGRGEKGEGRGERGEGRGEF